MLTPTALAAGTALQGLFQSELSRLTSVGEVALFRALGRALRAWRVPNVVETCEYHGRTHQVEHHTNAPIRQLGPKWCELCDVVVVSYAPKVRDARVTFLQAKLERNNVPSTGSPLQANMVQWSLLGTRAAITDHVSTFVPAPPPDLLSGAVLPSVGSFGFFHSAGGLVDLAFISAELLHPHSRVNCGPTSKSGRLSFPIVQQASIVRKNGSNPDDVSIAHGVVHFGAAIVQLLLGTPVPPGSVMARWLGLLVARIVQEHGGDLLLRELATLLASPGSVDGGGSDFNGAHRVAPRGDGPGKHPTVVLVRTSAAVRG